MISTAKKAPDKLRRFSRKTILLILAAILIVIAATVAYFVTRKSTNNASNDQNQNQQADKQPEQVVLSDERKKALQAELAEFKETFAVMGEINLSDTQKRELYVAAAFVAAQLREAEAKEYAKTALSLMPPEFLEDPNNQAFVQSLRDIEAGNYDAYINGIQPSE